MTFFNNLLLAVLLEYIMWLADVLLKQCEDSGKMFLISGRDNSSTCSRLGLWRHHSSWMLTGSNVRPSKGGANHGKKLFKFSSHTSLYIFHCISAFVCIFTSLRVPLQISLYHPLYICNSQYLFILHCSYAHALYLYIFHCTAIYLYLLFYCIIASFIVSIHLVLFIILICISSFLHLPLCLCISVSIVTLYFFISLYISWYLCISLCNHEFASIFLFLYFFVVLIVTKRILHTLHSYCIPAINIVETDCDYEFEWKSLHILYFKFFFSFLFIWPRSWIV